MLLVDARQAHASERETSHALARWKREPRALFFFSFFFLRLATCPNSHLCLGLLLLDKLGQLGGYLATPVSHGEERVDDASSETHTQVRAPSKKKKNDAVRTSRPKPSTHAVTAPPPSTRSHTSTGARQNGHRGGSRSVSTSPIAHVAHRACPQGVAWPSQAAALTWGGASQHTPHGGAGAPVSVAAASPPPACPDRPHSPRIWPSRTA